jgi:hypothetical protein
LKRNQRFSTFSVWPGLPDGKFSYQKTKNTKKTKYQKYQKLHMVYFHTKNPNWVYFGGSRDGKCWFILWPFGNFVVIWFHFSPFWYT